MIKEIWKDIPNYEGLYQASNLGKIKSLTRIVNRRGNTTRTVFEKILITMSDGKGYRLVNLNKLGVTKMYTIHRLILSTFVKNIENKPQVNHINGIKNDNRLVNLEWVTISENGFHAYKNGLQISAKGEKANGSKLKNEQILEIRKIGKTLPIKELANLYNISISTISMIINNKIWTHI